MNRRDFIKGLFAASGLSILGFPKVSLASSPYSPSPEEAPPLPWKYEELDPEYVRKLGHLGLYCFGCGGGSFWAIMWALREKIGYPYTLVPIPSKDDLLKALSEGKKPSVPVPMQFGVAGGVGWASLCGALNGSAAAINIATEWSKAQKIIKMLFRWYEETSFPSDISNGYAVRHEFLVPKYKSDKALPQSVSGSVLCHISVSKWCVRSGYASGSPERGERCARLTGDTVAKAVEFLNASLRGELETVYPFKLSSETAECTTCHYMGKNYEEGQFTKGLLACEACHQDLRPHIAESTLRTAFGVDVGTWAGAATVGTLAGIGAHLAVSNLRGKEEKDGEEE